MVTPTPSLFGISTEMNAKGEPNAVVGVGWVDRPSSWVLHREVYRSDFILFFSPYYRL